ncbi:MAG: glycosyltransferase family 9 protein [Thermodesulfobacteriota bacterium]
MAVSPRLRRNLRHAYLRTRGAVLGPFAPAAGGAPLRLPPSPRLLVHTMDRLGDFVCSLPALACLHQNIAGAEITVCAPAYLRQLLEAQPFCHRWLAPGGTGDRRFDAAIDFSADYPLAKTLHAKRLGVPERIGFDVAGRGAFLTRPLPVAADSHMVDRLGTLLAPLGLTLADRAPRLAVAADWRQQPALLRDTDIRRPYAVLHPGGTYPSQRWPRERFADLARLLARETDIRPLLIGAPGERQLCDEVAARAGISAGNLCGRLSMGGLAALLEGAALLIANNSGPLHLAVAVGCPTVSTMGPTLAEVWWPLGDKHTVLRRQPACSPCNEGHCPRGDHACLRRITVAEAWEAVVRRLDSDGRTGRGE